MVKLVQKQLLRQTNFLFRSFIRRYVIKDGNFMNPLCAMTPHKKNIEKVEKKEHFPLMHIKKLFLLLMAIFSFWGVTALASENPQADFPCPSNWDSEAENNGLFSLNIRCENGKKYIGYTFTYNSGRKINTNVWTNDKIILSPLGERCAFAVFFDMHQTSSNNKAKVILCQNNDALLMMKVDLGYTFYIPDYAKFTRLCTPSNGC